MIVYPRERCVRATRAERPAATRTRSARGSVSRYQSWKETPAAQQQRRSGLVGSPETLRRRLRKFEESNIDQVILLNQAGKNTHADICASLDLFAREVMPEFHAREPEHQEWKRRVLAGEIELPEVDLAALPAPARTRQSAPPAQVR